MEISKIRIGDNISNIAGIGYIYYTELKSTSTSSSFIADFPSEITSIADGLMLIVHIPSTLTNINTNVTFKLGTSDAKPVCLANGGISEKISPSKYIHANDHILLRYSSSKLTTGAWELYVISDSHFNAQYITSNEYRNILFSGSSDNTGTDDRESINAGVNNNVTINPSTGDIKILSINGTSIPKNPKFISSYTNGKAPTRSSFKSYTPTYENDTITFDSTIKYSIDDIGTMTTINE